jgi:hypothetical protein
LHLETVDGNQRIERDNAVSLAVGVILPMKTGRVPFDLRSASRLAQIDFEKIARTSINFLKKYLFLIKKVKF